MYLDGFPGEDIIIAYKHQICVIRGGVSCHMHYFIDYLNFQTGTQYKVHPQPAPVEITWYIISRLGGDPNSVETL